jgi:hypothetical protein
LNKVIHSNDLQKSAKAYFETDGSPDLLAERVEEYTEWDGELNEIVHHSRRGVNGKDVLIHIMLSDDIGADQNKRILFSNNFSYLGIKIGVNSKGGYCIVMDFATYLGNDIPDQRYETANNDPRGMFLLIHHFL